MSQRDPDINYQRADQVLPFAIREHLKQVHTALPGIVTAYAPATRRAQVQIAINKLIGSRFEHESVPRPVLQNVPVVTPGGGGYLVHVPLEAGDPVMLIFSERGLDAFKATFERSDPPIGAMFSERDAVCFPGFGALEIETPADGISIQAEDGSSYVEVHDDRVRAKWGENQVDVDVDGTTVTGNLRVTGETTLEGDVTAEANADVQGNLDVDGTGDVGGLFRANDSGSQVGGVTVKTHVHTGVQTGGGVSGPPR